MKGICKLTRKDTELRNSHIYPKFVIEWMKSTGSKYQRGLTTPNKREQDGYKKYLLSEEAEQLFSKRENWFAKNIFKKYLADRFVQMSYDENLYYFAISFLWRILVLELDDPSIKDFNYHQTLLDTEKQWREFLLNGIYPVDYDNIHLILSDDIRTHTLPSHNVDYYFTRLMDGTTVFNDKCCSLYGKFSKFIFWSFLIGDDDKMINTRINPIKGVIGFPQKFENHLVISFFPNRIKIIDEMMIASENQQNLIQDEILNNLDHYSESELFQSREFDQEMNEKNKKNSW